MSLWIRSQDKEQLLQVERLFLRDKMICTNIREVLGWTLLGEYSSKKRALEVLDEINDLLEQEEIFHIRKSSLNNLDDLADPKYILNPVGQPRVYTMPIE